ncbi:hypothetical protein HMI54_004209 [Coelomomyces lativittatus]|nr:hypothetical protein HMI54_004209 [Coelomomyces lativittatus]
MNAVKAEEVEAHELLEAGAAEVESDTQYYRPPYRPPYYRPPYYRPPYYRPPYRPPYRV